MTGSGHGLDAAPYKRIAARFLLIRGTDGPDRISKTHKYFFNLS